MNEYDEAIVWSAAAKRALANELDAIMLVRQQLIEDLLTLEEGSQNRIGLKRRAMLLRKKAQQHAEDNAMINEQLSAVQDTRMRGKISKFRDEAEKFQKVLQQEEESVRSYQQLRNSLRSACDDVRVREIRRYLPVVRGHSEYHASDDARQLAKRAVKTLRRALRDEQRALVALLDQTRKHGEEKVDLAHERMEIERAVNACIIAGAHEEELSSASIRDTIERAKRFIGQREKTFAEQAREDLRTAMSENDVVGIEQCLSELQKNRILGLITLSEVVRDAKQQRARLKKYAYDQLKKACGWESTATMTFLQQPATDVPAGMISEWSYNIARDEYMCPSGATNQHSVAGIVKGAAEFENLHRVTSDTRGYCYLCRKTGGVASVSWLFVAENGSFFTNLRVKAVSSVFGEGKISWDVRGGVVTGSEEVLSERDTRVLSSNLEQDFSKHIDEWTWVQLKICLSGNRRQPDDTQLFRALVTDETNPQFSVKLGLSMKRSSKRSNEIADVMRALQNCERSAVATLGSEARNLMQDARRMVSDSS